MKSLRDFLLAAALVLTLAKIYSIEAQDKSEGLEKPQMSEKQLFRASKSLEIALSALDNPQWKIRDSKYKIKLNPSEDGWRVVVTFLPETPGEEAYISVNNDGAVKVVPGF